MSWRSLISTKTHYFKTCMDLLKLVLDGLFQNLLQRHIRVAAISTINGESSLKQPWPITSPSNLLQMWALYLLRGNIHAACGRHQEAISDYDKAAACLSQFHSVIQDTVFFNRGNSKAELSDYGGALKDYTEAIRINPNLSQAYYNRGNTYIDLYRFEEALLDYDRVTGHGPGDTAGNREIALIALGRFAEARRGYLEARAKGANHARIAQNLWTLEQIIQIVDDLSTHTQLRPFQTQTLTQCV